MSEEQPKQLNQKRSEATTRKWKESEYRTKVVRAIRRSKERGYSISYRLKRTDSLHIYVCVFCGSFRHDSIDCPVRFSQTQFCAYCVSEDHQTKDCLKKKD